MLTLALAITAMLVGCQTADKLVYDNYARIQPHLSTESDVAQIIGHPSNKLGERWMYDRPDRHLHVFVDFDESGRVERKQWIDAAGETWEDSADTDATGSSNERTDIRTTNP
jgi:hypothetical protein